MNGADEDDFYDSILARTPEYVQDMRDTEHAIAAGNIGQLLEEVLAEQDTKAP